MKSNFKIVSETNELPRGKDVPEPPQSLTNGIAIEEWYAVGKDLVEQGVEFTRTVMTTLEGYCAQISIVRECQMNLETEGLIVSGKPNEKLVVMNNAQKLALALGDKLTTLSKKEKKTSSVAGERNGWNPKLLA